MSRFIERRQEMRAIEKYLLLEKQSDLHSRTRRKTFLLHGLGGMGKTQLAVAFAREHHEKFSAIFWLDGSSIVRLKQAFVDLAGRLPSSELSVDLRESLEAIPPNIDLVVKGVLQWLSLPSNKYWLLVIDNVDRDWIAREKDPLAYDLRVYFPPADHGSILVTGRLAGMLESPGLFEAELHIDRVNNAQAEGILERTIGRELEGMLRSDSDYIGLVYTDCPRRSCRCSSDYRQTGPLTSGTYPSWLVLATNQHERVFLCQALRCHMERLDGDTRTISEARVR
jgi:hypothetical protein